MHLKLAVRVSQETLKVPQKVQGQQFVSQIPDVSPIPGYYLGEA